MSPPTDGSAGSAAARRLGLVLVLCVAAACTSVVQPGYDPPPGGDSDGGTVVGCGGSCGGTTEPGSAVEGGVAAIPVPTQNLGGPCVTSIDCAGDLECGYDPTKGCSAAGACVAQVSGAEAPAACGCDGIPVQYVAPGFTREPVASPLPCGGDAGDADGGETEESDAAPDAADGGDGGDGG